MVYVIGTAGHVDHGKSRLVHALTGIDPDRLREEKSRGMTIDLGFAWMTLPSGRIVSIVDVPGHQRFIRNMLAGAGGIDIALLVVAADDGVMPQTREHLAILDLLGVSRGVVALTKCDLVDDEWRSLVAQDVLKLLETTALSGSPAVPCSSLTGEGLADLRAALVNAVPGPAPRRDTGRPRLPIDRVFTMAGFGTVVTGTLIDGAIRPGDELQATPGGARVRVRGAQSHGAPVACAQPGTRVALNLSGGDRHDLHRGVLLAPPGTVREARALDVRVRALASNTRSLRHNMSVTFYCLAAETPAQLRLLEDDALSPGTDAWAQLRLDNPVAALPGDRFVLRTPDDTVGGGIVVVAGPKRHRRRDPALFAALAARLVRPPAEAVLDALNEQAFLGGADIAARTGLPADAVAQAIANLMSAGRLLLSGPRGLLAATERVEQLAADARATLAEYHRAHPLRSGMPLEELRARLRLDEHGWQAFAGTLAGVRIERGTASLSTFEPHLTAAQEREADAFLAAITEGVAPPPLDGELRRYLSSTGAIVDASGVLFDGGRFREMERVIMERLRAQGPLSLAEARDLLGTNRKTAQAVLEELDRRRVTRRVGDARVLR
jgi:selenocysteine-specific elongation factor